MYGKVLFIANFKSFLQVVDARLPSFCRSPEKKKRRDLYFAAL
jgi:hypothetical protein